MSVSEQEQQANDFLRSFAEDDPSELGQIVLDSLQPPSEIAGFYGERHRWRPMEGHYMGVDSEDAPSGVEGALDTLTENLNDSPDAEEYVARAQASWQAMIPVLEQNGLDPDNVIAVATDTGVRYAHVRIDDDTVDVVALREVNQTAQDAWWESDTWAEMVKLNNVYVVKCDIHKIVDTDLYRTINELGEQLHEKYGVPIETLQAKLNEPDEDTEPEKVSVDDLDDLFSEIDGLVQEGEE